jgi:tetratricopeptide (TPR) repeat protein
VHVRIRSLLAAVTLGLTMAAGAAPAHAALSEYLERKIAEAHSAEGRRDFDFALSVYRQAIDRRDIPAAEMRVLLKKRAAVYEQLNFAEKAEADFTAALSVEPVDARAYADRGYFYLRQAKYDPALSDFVTGSRIEPANPMFLYGAARVLVAAGDFASAVMFYDEAIARAPRDAKLHLARAEAKVRLNAFEAARDDYDRAFALGLSSRGDLYFGYSGRGYVSLRLRADAAAIRDFDAALRLDPSAQQVLMWRGHAYERQGLRPQALADYEQALRLMPESDPARAALDRLRASPSTLR